MARVLVRIFPGVAALLLVAWSAPIAADLPEPEPAPGEAFAGTFFFSAERLAELAHERGQAFLRFGLPAGPYWTPVSLDRCELALWRASRPAGIQSRSREYFLQVYGVAGSQSRLLFVQGRLIPAYRTELIESLATTPSTFFHGCTNEFTAECVPDTGEVLSFQTSPCVR